MDNYSSKELCEKLMHCEDEADVKKHLENANLWDNENWDPYGGKSNNAGSILNQQNNAENALVEKLTNSIDHVLIRKCWTEGIDPKASNAPDNMWEAVEKFFDVRDGRIKNLKPKRRSELAEQIKLVASGEKKSPCYTIIDEGEGQCPDDFPRTLVGLSEDNKKNIPFVQGKFHMGGSGSLRFCGKHMFQLIVSRRHPNLAKDGENLWGFTVIRKKPAEGRESSSSFVYLAPEGKVPRFQSDDLIAAPGEYPHPRGKPIRYGTLVKLFNYKMRLKTNITLDLSRRLSILLPSPPLPVRLYERRKGYKAHSYENNMSGLITRLEDDTKDRLEWPDPPSFSMIIERSKLKGQIYLFKRLMQDKFSSPEGVILTVNGQLHASLSKKLFFSGLNMDYIKKDLLIILDCDDLTVEQQEEIFMASRDRLVSDDPTAKKIKSAIKEILKNHEGLKECNARRMSEEINNRISESETSRKILAEMRKRFPSLDRYLSPGKNIPTFIPQKGAGSAPIKLKNVPSYFLLQKAFSAEKPKKCCINEGFRVKFVTDVVDNYFGREEYPGEYKLTALDQEISELILTLYKGKATLSVKKLPDNVEVGDTVKYEMEVNDRTQIKPFREVFYIQVEKEIDRSLSNSPSKPRRPQPSDSPGGEEQSLQNLDPPKIIPVRKEDYEELDFDPAFNDKDALAVKAGVNLGEFNFYINLDNEHLLWEMRGKSPDKIKILEAQFQHGLFLLGMGLLDLYEDDKDKIRDITKAIALFLIPTINYLGGIK